MGHILSVFLLFFLVRDSVILYYIHDFSFFVTIIIMSLNSRQNLVGVPTNMGLNHNFAFLDWVELVGTRHRATYFSVTGNRTSKQCMLFTKYSLRRALMLGLCFWEKSQFIRRICLLWLPICSMWDPSSAFIVVREMVSTKFYFVQNAKLFFYHEILQEHKWVRHFYS